MAESINVPPRKRKHVTNACDECRRRRVRCNGGQPCISCSKGRLTCTYAVSLANPDLRFNRVTAEQYHELSTHQTILRNLVASIRRGEAERVLNDIRAGASISEIGASLLRQQDDKEVGSDSRNDVVSEEFAGASAAPSTNKDDSSSPVQSSDSASAPSSNDCPDRSEWHPSLQARWDRNEVVMGREFEPDPADSPYTAPPAQWESTRRPVFSRPFSLETPNPHANKSLGHRVREHSPRPRKRVTVSSTQSPAQSDIAITSFGNLPPSSAINANHYPPLTQGRQHLNFSVPEHLLMPLMETDNSPLGKLYLGFQQAGRKTIYDTGRPGLVIDGLIPEADNLFESPAQFTGVLTPYKWAYDINRSFEGIFSSATCLANAIIGGRLMRWLIYPSAETYASVPEILRPTISQRMIPHPAQVDLFLFPGLRDSMLIETGDFIGGVIESGMELDWPYSLNEAFVFDMMTGKLQVAPLFVAYATDSSKWKVGGRFLNRFPHLKDVVNVSDEAVIKPVNRFL